MHPSPLRRQSPKRAAQQRLYTRLRLHYLAEHPDCQIGPLRGLPQHPATDIHHQRGRVGKLLCDTRHWLSCCRQCHEWAHEHPKQARAVGALAPAREWNVVDNQTD